MQRKYLIGSLGLVILILSAVSVIAQTAVQFRLSGKHTFHNDKADIWSVSQELIDEKSGASEKNENFAEAKGGKTKLDLVKVKNKETIYHITASGENFSFTFKVRVFEPNKISSFLYKSGQNPSVRTYILVPKSLSRKTKVLLVMHGRSRNAGDYIASWKKWAPKNDFIVVAPLFDRKNWAGSRRYNLGNIFTSEGLKKHRSTWSFQVVENLHKIVRDGFKLRKEYFDIFGHSAGGQFVHRFMFFMPKANVRTALAANSGWYTLPDVELKYPYGFEHQSFSYSADDILNYSKRNVVLLRGTDDTERTESLRQTPEADAQGKNRFERAGFMYQKIKAINPHTSWRLVDAQKIGHDQKGMAVPAQLILALIESQTKKAER